jgi:hypothetical protein
MKTAVAISREVLQAGAVAAEVHLLGKRVSIVPSCHSATLRHWANPSRALIDAFLTPSGLDSLSTLKGPVSPAICHPRHYRPAPHCSIFGNFRHLCASIHAPCSTHTASSPALCPIARPWHLASWVSHRSSLPPSVHPRRTLAFGLAAIARTCGPRCNTRRTGSDAQSLALARPLNVHDRKGDLLRPPYVERPSQRSLQPRPWCEALEGLRHRYARLHKHTGRAQVC